ncbi:hypothetical protein LZ009_16615 [Ramlibacter sp. XY19]|uniref:hypothetical protein n=1 Tax=Ramlibacter paludis TaxID=2908000 RepID=UPI0023DCC5AC|nr:hypothetical protein [Ramlibacter paludis]MCG2594401.1 hypothetical protein [Ramlibacter paludis]
MKTTFLVPALLAAALAAPSFAATPEAAAKADKPAAPAKAAKASAKKTSAKKPQPAAKAAAKPQKPGPLADFGAVTPSADVKHVANWVSYTHNAGNRAFVLVDKKSAQVYVFDPKGKLVSNSTSPVLLGLAPGDAVHPVGNKPISKLKEEEKNTPAGKFLAQPGKNNHGANIIWIDYKNSLSMHSMHSVSAAERRGDRMATPDPEDNKISNGCINVPPKFYSSVVWPTVRKYGAYVYVLPETRTPQQQFGSFDVPIG